MWLSSLIPGTSLTDSGQVFEAVFTSWMEVDVRVRLVKPMLSLSHLESMWDRFFHSKSLLI